MSATELLQVSDQQYRDILQIYGKTSDEILEYVTIIKKWIKQSPHLPDIETDDRIQRFLYLNKFHIEKTKFKLDNYYTLRNLIPEFFQNRHPLHPSIQNLMDTVAFIPLPKLAEDYTRVNVFKFLDSNPAKFVPYDFFKFTIVLAEMRLTYDKCLGDHFIFDLSNTKLGHFIKISPMMLKHTQTVVEKALTDRMQGLHYINAPSSAMTVINLTKAVFKEKLANRIHVHKDLSSLYEIISKKILPSDYGGNEKSVQDLQNSWKKFLADNNDWFLKEGKISSNEKLRPEKLIENELLGYQGSFRKLELD